MNIKQIVSLRPGVSRLGLLLLSFTVLFGVNTAGRSFDKATLKGSVRAVGSSGSQVQRSAVANAVLTLTNIAAPDRPLHAVSDANGDFIFDGLASGDYTLTVEASGLSRVSKQIHIESGGLLVVDIDMNATVTETVTVKPEEGLLSSSDVTTSNIVRGETLKEQPLRTDNFQNAIPLTPGAVRDGSGNDYIKGARSGASGYTVNGVDVTDASTGNLAFDIPLEAANSVQVEDNPYAASYGRFTGGVTNLQTKGGGDKFKVTAARFFPALHNIVSTKVDSFRPRVTFSGPLVKQRLYFLVSGEYRYSRIFVPSQPKGSDASIQQNQNLFSQVDWVVNARNMVKLTASVSPGTFRHYGLDTFNPANVTPDLKQRSTLFTLSEQSVFSQSSFLSSQVSYKTSRMNVLPPSTADFNVTPSGNSGSYFAGTNRWNGRLQWQETLFLPHFSFVGEHAPSAGVDYFHTFINGDFHYRPIDIRRQNGTLAERITFTRATSLKYDYAEADAYVQDRWTVTPKLTLDYGARLDRDGITRHNNFAPRFALMAKPFGSRTTVRAGAGLFYERAQSPAGYFSDDDPDDAGAIFKRLPRRVVTTYAADGTTVLDGPRLFKMRVAGPLTTPRSFRWSVQVDRSFTSKLTARIGYTRRTTTHDLLIDRTVGTGTTGAYVLSSRGRSSYDEVQTVVTYSGARLGSWTGFYTYSRSRGDLNTNDLVFSDTPAITLRPNEYGPLPFDSPHRFMFYGQIDVSKKLGIRLSPLVEVRSGFPFTAVNERLEAVGARDSLRFPKYFSLDLQGTKSIKVPFSILKDKKVRVGLAVLNVTNHFNPRDVANNVTSPNFGKFYNSLGTSIKAKIDVDF